MSQHPHQPANAQTAQQTSLQAEIEALGPWFHNLHLPDGSQTAPDHFLHQDFPNRKWQEIAPHIPDDLTGWTALDIGCNAGFYSFELAKRGATVTAIDRDPRYLQQAAWAARQFGLEQSLTFQQQQVYDLARTDTTYDIVWFMGVFYHLRYAMLGLDIAAHKARRLFVFQTMTLPGNEVYEATGGLGLKDRAVLHAPGWPKMAFIEQRFENDPTNWWVPNHAGVLAMLRSVGMRLLAMPGHEIYLCEPDTERSDWITRWSREELLSATGQHNALNQSRSEQNGTDRE